MSIPITTTFAALFILMGLALTIRTIGGRRNAGVSVGDGGDETLHRLMRAHSNFIETVPLLLVGMLLIEINGVASWWLVLLGLALLAARISHAIGMEYRYPNIPFRLVGMATTLLVFVLVALTLLVQVALG
ncbi:MAG: MAPEG family protein [Pseudomonadota bacterium]